MDPATRHAPQQELPPEQRSHQLAARARATQDMQDLTVLIKLFVQQVHQTKNVKVMEMLSEQLLMVALVHVLATIGKVIIVKSM
jgi:hypothetical protein